MKKNLVLILFILISLASSQAYAKELGIRDLYNESDKSKINSEIFYNQARKEFSENPQNPTCQAYLGASLTVLAKFGFNPFSKIKNFKEGKDLIENAVIKDPRNLEIRYIRLGVQSYVPFFLNYKDDIEKDKAIILDAIKNKSFKDKDLMEDSIELLKAI